MNRIAKPNLRAGLIAHWCPAAEKSRTALVIDRSGYGNNGTLTNADVATAWSTPTDRGQGMTFDGSNDYAATTFNPSKYMPNGTNMAMFCWLRTSNFAIQQFVYGIANAPRWYVFIDPSRTVFFGVGSYAVNSLAVIYPNDGRVHQLAIIKTGTSVAFCMDGQIISTQAYSGDNILPNANIPFGAQGTGINPVNGQLLELAIYNRSITVNELKTTAVNPGVLLQTVRDRRGRRSAPTFKAAWITSRQSQIIGGGMR